MAYNSTSTTHSQSRLILRQQRRASAFPSTATRTSGWLAAGSRMTSRQILRAVSDYDLTHQVNANWIVDLPVGKERALAHDSGKVVDALIGGWQLTGLARWTSGFPFSIDGGQRWPANWFLTAIAEMTSRPQTGVFKRNGSVCVFADPSAAQADFTLPLPGGVGSRNILRGDGFASWDMSLGKRWAFPRGRPFTPVPLGSIQRAQSDQV
jgi:hypothetical protein